MRLFWNELLGLVTIVEGVFVLALACTGGKPSLFDSSLMFSLVHLPFPLPFPIVVGVKEKMACG